MKRILLLVIAICAFSTPAFAADIRVAGANGIAIGSFFDAPVEVSGMKSPVKIELAGGKLPYGLHIMQGRVTGYPAAVERAKATFRVTDAAGKKFEKAIPFAIVDGRFRLIYHDLPVAPLKKSTTVKIEGQGGKPPYSGCRIEQARTFFAGAAKFGSKTPAEDAAPKWLRLKDNCALVATPDKEVEVLMIISARDASGATASEFFALRSAADPKSTGWLEAKAREYNKDYQERFSPNGLTLERDPNGAWVAYGDSAIWTGTYLAGAAYYYAVTGESYALANLNKALDATTNLRLVTGKPGLIARAFEKDEWIGKRPTPDIPVDPSKNCYEVKDGPMKGFRFRGTASRDQYTGVFWGNATVWEFIDNPKMRAAASENIVSMASHIWDNQMKIIDVDGKMTHHGLMSGMGISDSEGNQHYDPYTTAARMPNGFNAALLLNWFDMAATVAPDAAARSTWRKRYLDLTSKEPNPEPGRSFERDYLSNLKKVYVYGEKFIDYYDTVWFNLNLLFNNYHHLTRFEKDPKLKSVYRDMLRYFWQDKQPMKDGCEAPKKRRAGREGNPHFTWQYLAAMGDREPVAIFNAVSRLMEFPRGPKTPFNVVDPVEWRTIKGHPDWTCEPVPAQYRNVEDFYWQRGTYTTPQKASPGEWGRQLPGVDVITPYWMGRYFGYIPGNI